jgi:NAD(P)-dependent dehydrogenase (short-subunit alcohol dehydrogenase family)
MPNTTGTVVVTGGASGIGQTVVDTLLETTGHRCAVLDLVADAAPSNDDRRLTVACDVTDPDDVAAAIDAVHAWGAPIVGLVNSAGIAHATPTLELDYVSWHRVLDVHVDGTFLVSQQVARRMVAADGGAIVNLGSVAGSFGYPSRLAYSAAKAAIAAMTRTMAVEWAEYGIRVNCVAPGYIETPLVATLVDDGKIDGPAYRALHVLNRFGTPREVADVVLFLLSDAASFVTAETVRIDGGFSALKVPSTRNES